MSISITNQMLLASAVIALAGCSAALSQEASSQQGGNTAITVQSGPDLASSLDGGPPAPLPAEDIPPPLLAPEPVPPVTLTPPVVEPRAAAPARASTSCEIFVDRTANGVVVTPVVHAGRLASGAYRLVITKSGPGGSSDISQGGPVDAARGETVELGASEFSLERGATFRAVLTITDGGREICRDVRTLI